jgi:hypothetical protein
MALVESISVVCVFDVIKDSQLVATGFSDLPTEKTAA